MNQTIRRFTCFAVALSAVSASPAALAAGEPEAAGAGAIFLPLPLAQCVASVENVAVAGQCTRASSLPKIGQLYPLSQDLFVSPSGEVGIGTTQPTSQLTVDGIVHSLSGGFRFPDGSVQTTQRTVGVAGETGDQGDQGVKGQKGLPGLPGVVPLNGLSGPSLTLATTGAASVSASGNTITVSAPAVACTYGNKTYTTGQFCHLWPDEIPCSVGFRQTKLTCLAGGSWQSSTTACNNPSLPPTCGI